MASDVVKWLRKAGSSLDGGVFWPFPSEAAAACRWNCLSSLHMGNSAHRCGRFPQVILRGFALCECQVCLVG